MDNLLVLKGKFFDIYATQKSLEAEHNRLEQIKNQIVAEMAKIQQEQQQSQNADNANKDEVAKVKKEKS